MLPEDAEPRLAAWLAAEVDPAIHTVAVTRLAGGHSSGAWRLDATGGGPHGPYVLKAPGEPSVVYRRDACREARIIRDLSRLGAPVPEVVAIDDGTVLGRPCFAMALIGGRGLADGSAGGFHDDEELRAAGPEAQRAVWEAFHDGLAALHRVDPAGVPDASLGGAGQRGVIEHWRASLLDVGEPAAVPRQLALLDWLAEHLPPGADDAPAVCIGDARIANGIVDGADVAAIIDFEVAYLGNPAADVGYSLFFSGMQRAAADPPLPGIPGDDETWARWGQATGRGTEHRAYWTAFGALVLAITATRAVVQWGIAGDDLEASNPLVERWEQAARKAGR